MNTLSKTGSFYERKECVVKNDCVDQQVFCKGEKWKRMLTGGSENFIWMPEAKMQVQEFRLLTSSSYSRRPKKPLSLHAISSIIINQSIEINKPATTTETCSDIPSPEKQPRRLDRD